jgi:hypothetical protein
MDEYDLKKQIVLVKAGRSRRDITHLNKNTDRVTCAAVRADRRRLPVPLFFFRNGTSTLRDLRDFVSLLSVLHFPFTSILKKRLETVSQFRSSINQYIQSRTLLVLYVVYIYISE